MCVPSAGSAIGIPKIRNNCENAARRQRQVAARLGTTSRMNGLRWKTADGKSRTNCTRQQSSDSAAKCVASLPGRHHSEKYCDPTPGKPIYATEFSDFQVYSEYIAPVELFAGSYYSKSTVLQSPSKKKKSVQLFCFRSPPLPPPLEMCNMAGQMRKFCAPAGK